MTGRRWALLGGAIVIAAAAMLVPAASNAFQSGGTNVRYVGEINGTASPGDVQIVQNGSVCQFRSDQYVNVDATSDSQKPKTGTGVVNYTVTVTGPSGYSLQTLTGSLDSFTEQDSLNAGSSFSCTATGISVAYAGSGNGGPGSTSLSTSINNPYD